MTKSINELLAEGWSYDPSVTCDQTYPLTDHIVMQKDGEFLQHRYRVRDDSSDYPGLDQTVQWVRVEVYEVVKRLCRSKVDRLGQL